MSMFAFSTSILASSRSFCSDRTGSVSLQENVVPVTVVGEVAVDVTELVVVAGTAVLVLGTTTCFATSAWLNSYESTAPSRLRSMMSNRATTPEVAVKVLADVDVLVRLVVDVEVLEDRRFVREVLVSVEVTVVAVAIVLSTQRVSSNSSMPGGHVYTLQSAGMTWSQHVMLSSSVHGFFAQAMLAASSIKSIAAGHM